MCVLPKKWNSAGISLSAAHRARFMSAAPVRRTGLERTMRSEGGLTILVSFAHGGSQTSAESTYVIREDFECHLKR